MASRLEEDLWCPVCRDVFRDPVLLSCSHSFCKDCLKSWWKDKAVKECPLCKRRHSKGEPLINLVLKNLCETFLQERDQSSSPALCSLHSMKLRLLCLDHQQPVCLVCRDSEKHTGHRFRPIDEAAQHKKQLQETLEPMKKKLHCFKRVKEEFEQTAEHIKVQAELTETQIKEQFKKASSVSGGGRGGQDGCTEGGRGAEESDDEGEDRVSEQRHNVSFRHNQNHRGRAESWRRLVPAPLQGCSGTSPAAPPAGWATAGLRSSDRRGQTSGQPELQHLEQDEGRGLLQSCGSGPKLCWSMARPVWRSDQFETRRETRSFLTIQRGLMITPQSWDLRVLTQGLTAGTSWLETVHAGHWV